MNDSISLPELTSREYNQVAGITKMYLESLPGFGTAPLARHRLETRARRRRRSSRTPAPAPPRHPWCKLTHFTLSLIATKSLISAGCHDILMVNLNLCASHCTYTFQFMALLGYSTFQAWHFSSLCHYKNYEMPSRGDAWCRDEAVKPTEVNHP